MAVITAFRICKTKNVAAALDGEGAWRYGGRWNSRGTRVIYLAGSLALAALEMLVHLQDEKLLAEYSYLDAQFDSKLIMTVSDFRPLPKDWHLSPAPLSIQQWGDAWAATESSAVLQVPTSIIPLENNYLLNPHHPDFKKIAFGKPRKFVFDGRLLKNRVQPKTSSNYDLDPSVLYSHFITLDRAAGMRETFAVSNIKTPSMPLAFDDVSIKA